MYTYKCMMCIYIYIQIAIGVMSDCCKHITKNVNSRFVMGKIKQPFHQNNKSPHMNKMQLFQQPQQNSVWKKNRCYF